ncbi:hypothetical protein ASA1KI_22410 [Opitutales bacterium ASA1]|uniref:hypothetical protein n=1 Tax=Congregicoccus parvus TaxID=3081749 RepID=UPI002B2A0236|nr:hypothetical protein ASA1KI_22410 [Opitutales bacterium ASA1]
MNNTASVSPASSINARPRANAAMSLPRVTRRSMTPEPLEFHPVAGLAEQCTRSISASATVQGLTILALVLGAAGSAYSLVIY